MQVARAGIEEACDVTLAGDPLANFFPLHEAQLVVAVVAFLLALPFEQLLALARLDADVHVSPDEVAVDAVLLDQFARQFDALDAEVPETLRIRRAELCGELRHAAGPARDELAARASRGSVANALGFEQHDLVAAPREMERGRAARQARADDANVRLDVSLELRQRAPAPGGRLVPAVGGTQAHTCSR